LSGPEVASRVLYDEQLLDLSDFIGTLRGLIEPREENRIRPSLPTKLLIVDRRTAVLPLARDATNSAPSCVVVYSSALLDALLALSEQYGEAGAPVRLGDGGGIERGGPGGGRGTGTPTREQREILSLLLAGTTDQTIARQLQISVRTVQRHVSELMT